MKNNKKSTNKKFDLEKFEVAKLKNMRVIVGGYEDPIDTNHKAGGASTGQCVEKE